MRPQPPGGVHLSHLRNGKAAVGELREWEGDRGVMESGSELAACWGAVGTISTLALPLGEMGVAPCLWRAFLFPPISCSREGDRWVRQVWEGERLPSRCSVQG